jgi:predicted transcriptional regulator
MTVYIRGRAQQKGRFGRWISAAGTSAVVIILFVVFVFAVMWFRQPKDEVEERIDSIAEVLRPDPISQAVLSGAIDTESHTATLTLGVTGETVGEARRGKKDERYFFELKATLPEIDREVFFYEAWLVRPIPYGFFSAGELVTNEEGDFIVEWEGENEKDYSGYVEVVITRQEYQGSTDPQAHIVEGTFGK